MQLDRALRFMFLDPTWPKKLGVAALILAVPGVVAALASQSLDAPGGVVIFVLALAIPTVGGIILYTHYSRIIESIAHDGRDLPLPPAAPLLEMIERAILIVCFSLIFFVTMIPLLCVVACPIVLLTSSIGSADGVIATLIVAIFLILTVGVIMGAYGLLGFSRYVVTQDFGGSLNPGVLLRLFRSNPGDWLLAAFLPAIASIVITVLRQLFIWLLPDAGALDDVLNTIISTPITAYTTLVGFHLAGQAYRLSNQPVTAVAAGEFVPTRNY